MDSQIREIRKKLKDIAFELFERLIESDSLFDKFDTTGENHVAVLKKELSKYRDETGITNDAMWDIVVQEVSSFVNSSLPQNMKSGLNR